MAGHGLCPTTEPRLCVLRTANKKKKEERAAKVREKRERVCVYDKNVGRVTRKGGNELFLCFFSHCKIKKNPTAVQKQGFFCDM